MSAFQRNIYFGLLGVKILLGILFINSLSIDLDEPFSIFHAQMDLSQLNRLFEHENNPPLHFWLLHFWIKLFGIDPWAVRSLSLFFSVLTIPILLQIGKKIRNTNTGLVLVALFVFSNFHHSFGLEARAYPLFNFLFAVSLLLLIQTQLNNLWKNALLLGVCTSLLFYTHYMAIVVVPVILFVFFIREIQVDVKRAIGASTVFLVVFAISSYPVLKPFIARFQHVSEGGTWVPKPQWTELYGFVNKFMNGPGFLISIFVLSLYLYFKHRNVFMKLQKIKFNSGIFAVFMVSVLVYFGSFALSKIASSSVFLDRYLFFVSIGFFILLAYAIDAIRKEIGIWAWLPFLAVVLGFKPWKTHNRASDELAAYASSFKGSYVISPPHYDVTFLYHFKRDAFQLKLSGKQLAPLHIYPVYSIEELNMDKLRKPIVLVDAGSQFLYGEQKLKTQLSERFKLIESRIFPGEYEVLVFE